MLKYITIMRNKKTIDYKQVFNFYYQDYKDSLYYENHEHQRFYVAGLVIYDQSVIAQFSEHSQNYLDKQLANLVAELDEINIAIKYQNLKFNREFNELLKQLDYQLDRQSIIVDRHQVSLLAKKQQVYETLATLNQENELQMVVFFYHRDWQKLKAIKQTLVAFFEQNSIKAQPLSTKGLLNEIKNLFHYQHQDRFGDEIFYHASQPTFSDFVNLKFSPNQSVYHNKHQQPFYFYQLDFQQRLNYINNYRAGAWLETNETLYYKWIKTDRQWQMLWQILISPNDNLKQHKLQLIKKWQPIYEQLLFFQFRQVQQRHLHKSDQTPRLDLLLPIVKNQRWLVNQPVIIGTTLGTNATKNFLIATDTSCSNLVIINHHHDLQIFYQLLTNVYLTNQQAVIHHQSDRLDPWLNYFQIEKHAINRFWHNPFGSAIKITDANFYHHIAKKSSDLWQLIKTYRPEINDRYLGLFQDWVEHLYKLAATNKKVLNWADLYVIATKTRGEQNHDFDTLLNVINLFSWNYDFKTMWTKPETVISYEKHLATYLALKKEYDTLHNSLKLRTGLVNGLEKSPHRAGALNINKQPTKTKSPNTKADDNHVPIVDLYLKTLNLIEQLQADRTLNTIKDLNMKIVKAKPLSIDQNLDWEDQQSQLKKVNRELKKLFERISEKLNQVNALLPIELHDGLNDNQMLVISWRSHTFSSNAVLKTIQCGLNQAISEQILLIYDQWEPVTSTHRYLTISDDKIDLDTTGGYEQLIVGASQAINWKWFKNCDEQLVKILNSVDHNYYWYDDRRRALQNQDSQQGHYLFKKLTSPIVKTIESVKDDRTYQVYQKVQRAIEHYQKQIYQDHHLSYQQAIYDFQKTTEINHYANQKMIDDNNVFVRRLNKN